MKNQKLTLWLLLWFHATIIISYLSLEMSYFAIFILRQSKLHTVLWERQQLNLQQQCWQSLQTNYSKSCLSTLLSSSKTLKLTIAFITNIMLWLRHNYQMRLHQNSFALIQSAWSSYLTVHFSRVNIQKWKFTLWLCSYQYEKLASISIWLVNMS